MAVQISRAGRSTPQTGDCGPEPRQQPANEPDDQGRRAGSRLARGLRDGGRTDWCLPAAARAAARRRISAKAMPSGKSISGRRDQAVDPVPRGGWPGGRWPSTSQARSGRSTTTAAIFSTNARPEQHADGDPPAAGVAARAALSRRRGPWPPRSAGRGCRCRSDGPGRRAAASAGANPPRPGPTQAPYRRARKPNRMVIVSGELDDRRHPPRRDVLHPRAEQGVGQQVELTGQRRVEVDAVPPVGPVIEQGVGIEQSAPGRRPSGPGPAAPTTGRSTWL